MIFIKEHIEKHPKVNWQDIVKLCYQASFGAEHMISDINSAENYFKTEYSSIEYGSGPLFEVISEDVCRVDMGAWKGEGLPGEWLFNLFLLSCNVCEKGKEAFVTYIEQAKMELPHMVADIDEYLSGGIRPVHHSSVYRENYQPHYRIIKTDLLRIIPILMEIRFRNARIIAIDGGAASGKTTMAKELCFVLKAGDVHMDDFFLPPQLRTPERLREAGGNVHYERFAEEVLSALKKKGIFSYKVFDCSAMELNGAHTVDGSSYCVVEGSYSHHPFFGGYADLKVFSKVDKTTQMKRILERNGEEMAEIFRGRWIPMEEKYFLEYSVEDNAHIVV